MGVVIEMCLKYPGGPTLRWEMEVTPASPSLPGTQITRVSVYPGITQMRITHLGKQGQTPSELGKQGQTPSEAAPSKRR